MFLSVRMGQIRPGRENAVIVARPLAIFILVGLLIASGLQAQSAGRPSVEAAASAANLAFKERPPYRIGPGDVLQITVWNEPQVSQASIIVLPDGKINLPLVGEIAVAGSTLKEIESQLNTLFKPFITDPDVSVGVKESNSQKIFVVGAVRKEGAIRLVTPLTILQAIAEAGGLTEFARRSKISVLRNNGTKQITLPFDYNAVIRGEKSEQNVLLQTGDTVVVPH